MDSSKKHPPPAPQTPRSRILAWAAVGLVLVAAAAVRWRLRDFPLERDEGEYAYAGQLILEGVPPYREAYNMKFPGTYAAYALLMAVFGQTPEGIHVGLIFVTSASTVLVFLLARRLLGTVAGVAAAASHAVLAISPFYLALAGHATHFVVPPALGGILLVLRGIERGRLLTFLWAGLSLGLSVMMKQPGVCFAAFAVAYLAWVELRQRPVAWRRLAAREGLILAGAAAPLGLACLILWAAGTFDKFWFWTFEYSRRYGTIVPLADGVRWFFDSVGGIIGATLGIWALAGIGLVAAAWDRKVRAAGPLMVGLLVFSFLGTSAGLYWRNHYFILMMPAVAILAGAAVGGATASLASARLPWVLRAVPSLVLASALAYAVGTERERAILFEMTPAAACRAIYGGNPFPESLEIARYIREHTSPQDRIAVLGSEPQIFFYAHRRSATGYVYTYGLMEPQPYAHQMQQEMIREIEAARPLYTVLVSVPTSWLARQESEWTIFEWAERYLAKHYQAVGLIDIQSMTSTEYYWDGQVAGRRPLSSCFLRVYRARPAAGGPKT